MKEIDCVINAHAGELSLTKGITMNMAITERVVVPLNGYAFGSCLSS